MTRSIRPNWPEILDCTERGPRPTLTNAVRVLQHDPLWGPDRVWYDEFLDRIMVANSPTHEWRDEDDYRLTVYMQETTGMSTVADHLVSKAVRLVAKQRPRHLVRDRWAMLEWDREPRIDLALEDHWGVVPDASMPCDYVRAASANFLIGIVARVFQPGCQLDTMIVFEGEQGLRKTSALRLLVGESCYMLAHESVTKKDFFETMRGKVLIEIGEMDAFSRAEVSRVKTVISTPTDRYRPSYGHAAIDYPRQCVFAGTTNRDDWGNDETGLRRFWPIKVGAINLETLNDARDQLFAEAIVRFRSGERWWSMPASTLSVQADRQNDSAWTDMVLTGLIGQTETTIAEVLMRILKHDASEITRTSELVVGRILRLAGWQKANLRRSGRQGKTWVAPETKVAQGSDRNFLLD